MGGIMKETDTFGKQPSQGGVSRRRLLQGAAALGVTATAGAGLLGSAAFSPASAAFDPKKYAGTKISILMTGDENDHRALADLLPEFEAETGMTLEITSPALGPLIEKTLQNLKAPQSSFELINYLGFLTTQQVGGGYFEQLNQYIDNPDETPADWDFGDFIPAAMKNVGIYDMKTGTVGQGSDVYGLPALHSGSVIYFYRKDLFEAAGLQPAKTWDEFKAAAEKLNTGDVAGCSFIGANDFSLATVDWYTRFITTGGKLMSGSPAEKNFKPLVDSPEGVGALQMLIDVLPFAPKNVTTYGFSQNVDGFSTGKIAQMIFWSTIAGPVFNTENSMVADKTGTGPVPAAPGQKASAIQGGWGVGIPKNVDPAKKPAAWRALTWITNKRINKYCIEKYQIDANRTSAFSDPELIKALPYLTDSMKAIENASTIPTSRIPEFFQMNDVMNVEFNKALIGGQDAKTACANVQKQWEDILRKAGHLT
jgi:ABC-type glycerol-3-phosphate transport system substrate-binding protein